MKLKRAAYRGLSLSNDLNAVGRSARSGSLKPITRRVTWRLWARFTRAAYRKASR